ncbi:hypothetical protein G4G27_12975 [Sphingomonas sp. So64.6b]|uniref:hypothetical protein n=1 Tax=Sphingomonas sp. So64.6b TaxID=2997354 RepID=UPI001600DB4E|nr:hypothetical protein [Sphingomonas sp. So64.6b]QNA84805.1 hypothetical protein G4G27_12975 [Sphingomonas sp. So64.6b]
MTLSLAGKYKGNGTAMFPAAAIAAMLLLSACGQEQAGDQNATSVTNNADGTAPVAPPRVAEKSPDTVPEAAKVSSDLSAYVGKYPRDKVAGQRFLDNPAVKSAIRKAVSDAGVQKFIYGTDGLNVPIFQKDGRIVAWGASNRAEDAHNWAVAITPDGTTADVCVYHSADAAATDEFPSSQWFSPGQKSTMMQGRCPSEKDDYPPKEIVAG